MSWIRNKCFCKQCDKELEYAWQLPDLKFEIYPDDNFIIANSDRYPDKYHVIVKCNNCGFKNVAYYTFKGELIDSQ